VYKILYAAVKEYDKCKVIAWKIENYSGIFLILVMPNLILSSIHQKNNKEKKLSYINTHISGSVDKNVDIKFNAHNTFME